MKYNENEEFMMKSVTLSLLQSAANAFDFGGPVLCDAHHYGEGHINDTFVVWREDHSKRFILQRINTDTFTNPVGLMENVCGVTRHLRAKILAEGGDPARETLNVIPTLSGSTCYLDADGGAWRAYDFGDSIRTGANDCAEDEPDQSKVHFDLHLYEVFAKGYLSTAGASMSMAEKKSLAWGARLMTLECGIRFLTDYLEGDHYFHIARPDHNLDRARTQFTLVRQMEEVFDQMLEIVCPDNH